MIDNENLRTASLYINNQLLSRGLLKDGQSIDFADTVSGNGDGAAATMGRIMSVVNDLILRRDRDAEHRESLSTTMRSLRTDNLKLTNDVTHLQEKNTETQRKLDIAQSSATSLKTQLKSADAAIRGLKDEVARTKAIVAQARSSCATEVRRRDRQIDTLKKQLNEAGRARGSRGNPAITTINVTGDFGAEKVSQARGASTTADDDYSLRSETNAFLAKLAQDLSEENEAILGAMRRTMERLRQMSGWSNELNEDGQVVKQPSWEDMSSELDSVLHHMTTILSNPSFVPIEEVEIREEEINRLKEGWVKMESRWREAVHLIDGWRKRMAASGRQVCDEELQMGLRLSPVRVKNVDETGQARGFAPSAVAEEGEEARDLQPSPCPPGDQSVDLVPAEGYDEMGIQGSDAQRNAGEFGTYQDEEACEGHEEDEGHIEALHESAAAPRQLSPDSSPLPEPPQLSPLRNSASAGNRGSLRNKKSRKKPGDFTTIIEENTRDLARDASPQMASSHDKAVDGPIPQCERSERPRSPSRTSLEEVLLSRTEPEQLEQTENEMADTYSSDEDELALPPQKSRRGPSKLPVPRNADAASQQSPLTMANIAAKLAASEREADAARVRAKLKTARATKRPSVAATDPTAAQQDNEMEDVDPVKHDREQQQQQTKPEKRKRDRQTSKMTSRRRSTLSPWELDNLMSGNVQ